MDIKQGQGVLVRSETALPFMRVALLTAFLAASLSAGSIFAGCTPGPKRAQGLVCTKNEILALINKSAFEETDAGFSKIRLPNDAHRLYYAGEAFQHIRQNVLIDLGKISLSSPAGKESRLVFAGSDFIKALYDRWHKNGGGMIMYDGKTLVFTESGLYFGGQKSDDVNQSAGVVPDFFDAGRIVFQAPTKAEREIFKALQCSLLKSESCSRAVLTDQSYGRIAFGSSIVAVEKGLGHKAEKLFDEQSCSMVKFKKYPGVEFMVIDGVVTRADIRDNSILNILNIYVGMPLADVKLLYPRAIIHPHQYDDEGHYVVFKSKENKRAVVFEESRGKITMVRAGLEPSAEYVEGCL